MARATNPLRDPLRHDASGRVFVDPPEPLNPELRASLIDKHFPDGIEGRPRTTPAASIAQSDASSGSGLEKTHHVFPHLWGPPSKLTITANTNPRAKNKLKTTSQDTYCLQELDQLDDDIYDRQNFVQKGNFTEYLRESIRKHVNLKKTAH
mmetsp:Transcript_9969/g.11585  ORF Transcript_9969/g.11585 Transcript_9969/m.11585 type:complete len:151 (+) Transcript_9969:112-564(+)|eukprot:CAMPEP_0197850662 /NCGR_PEP_ID=MMETSP1438-20131217/16025_1 /TAXON_ID=1461541 /ORGANISM="Pterosperma sp., Strain CCMP1384" /LENGTH=150 /DNA_ID=CAMNT_0043463947 /DNA_START=103 /DNA_END=555 /DNA_ORIENTATION=-